MSLLGPTVAGFLLKVPEQIAIHSSLGRLNAFIKPLGSLGGGGVLHFGLPIETQYSGLTRKTVVVSFS
jgi:hypothetical protein